MARSRLLDRVTWQDLPPDRRRRIAVLVGRLAYRLLTVRAGPEAPDDRQCHAEAGHGVGQDPEPTL